MNAYTDGFAVLDLNQIAMLLFARPQPQRSGPLWKLFGCRCIMPCCLVWLHASGLWFSRLRAGQGSVACCSASAQHLHLSAGTLSCTLGALCSVRNTVSLHRRRLVNSCVAAHAPGAGLTCDHYYRCSLALSAAAGLPQRAAPMTSTTPPLVHILKTAVGSPVGICARHTTTAETPKSTSPVQARATELRHTRFNTPHPPTHTALDGNPSKADTQKPQRVARLVTALYQNVPSASCKQTAYCFPTRLPA